MIILNCESCKSTLSTVKSLKTTELDMLAGSLLLNRTCRLKYIEIFGDISYNSSADRFDP